jgi:hypothetical protein
MWPDDFIRISNDRVLTLCRPMGFDTMAKARNGLKQKGLIDFKAGNKNKENPAYRMRYFYPENSDKGGFYPEISDNRGDNTGDNRQDNSGGNTWDNRGYIYPNINEKIYGTKTLYDDDHDEEDDNPQAREAAERTIRGAFRRCFGREAYPAEVGRLALCVRNGVSAELAAKALEIAALEGARKPLEYTLSILAEWRGEQVFTPQQADEYRAMFDRVNGRHGMTGTGDAAEDLRMMDAAREKRKAENAAMGADAG